MRNWGTAAPAAASVPPLATNLLFVISQYAQCAYFTEKPEVQVEGILLVVALKSEMMLAITEVAMVPIIFYFFTSSHMLNFMFA